MSTTAPLPFPAAESVKTDRDLVAHLEKAGIYHEFKKAFEATTGFPLALRAAGSFHRPLQGSRRINPFCVLLAGRSPGCSACLQLQERLETGVAGPSATLECFAGLSESVIPIRVGDRVVAFLQTGQVLRHAPSAAQFQQTLRQVGSGRLAAERRRLQAAYFGTRVVGPDQYDAVVQFLSIFAQHLGELSSQYLRRASAGEAPAVAKARAFILERQGEPLTLAQVAHAVNMSTFYFCKIFKKATGLTFTAYLAQVRIDTVKNLLRDPAKRVSEAAYEAGFQSLSQFNRVFHERVGESPSHYRDSLPAAAPAPAHPGEWRLATAV